MMTDEEIQHLRRLFAETRKRHDELEIQAARYGPMRVPAEIAVELREAEESMERLNAKLRIVTVPMNIQEATGPEASIDVLRLTVKELKDQMGTMWRYLENLILEGREETRVWRERQDRERQRGAWVYRVLFILVFAMIVYLAVR